MLQHPSDMNPYIHRKAFCGPKPGHYEETKKNESNILCQAIVPNNVIYFSLKSSNVNGNIVYIWGCHIVKYGSYFYSESEIVPTQAITFLSSSLSDKTDHCNSGNLTYRGNGHICYCG